MKQLLCPLNGLRNIQEFTHGGEVIVQPDPNSCSDGEWADFIFMEENKAGVVKEWWCHTATAYWFIADRDTVKDEILRTYDASEIYKDRVEFSRIEEPSDSSSKTKSG